VFAAGACSYGIADLSVLAADTHKFESRYTDRLVGPWPAARAIYAARSPIHHLDRFDRPLIVFQGLDDRVVPPNQSEMIVAALRARGVECEYHAYAGEGHGFRRAETIEHQLTSELAFYQRVLGLG
jgi:dipeptidyl aminopeptidase/acylaminoacyl peptidase